MQSDAKRARMAIEDSLQIGASTDAAITGTISQEIILKAVPVTSGQSVQKLECCLSFEDQKSPGGLFVDVIDKRAFGPSYVAFQHELTGHRVFIRIQKVAKTVENDTSKQSAEESGAQVKVLGLGVDGGFGDVEESEEDKYDETISLVLFPDKLEVLYATEGPSLIADDARAVVDSILNARDSERSTDVAAFVVDDDRKVSKYADSLPQLDNGVKISHNSDDWACAESGMKENLWLNLSTGHIGSGRRQFDGSGGTGAALKHYNDTGKKYPLCVKLGTITENGADVYSYAEDEDDLVVDPKLYEHLAHWGLDPKTLKKTEKSMEEMNLDLNQKFDFALIQESNHELVPLSGPGHTGLINLGNSCYMSSVLQCLFHLPYHRERYTLEEDIRKLYKSLVNGSSSESNPSENFLLQMVKLGGALCNGLSLSKEVVQKSGNGVAPRAVKAIVGKGHYEFSTGRQQDAVEYFQHFIEFEEKYERKLGEQAKGNPSLQFGIGLEDKIKCNSSGKVKYKKRQDNVLSLFVPMDAAINTKEVKEFEEMRAEKESLGEKVELKDLVRPKVPLQACIESFAQPEIVDDFYSPATKSKTTATKTTKIDSFPDVLALNIRRFIIGENWEPKKLDVEIAVPDELDFEWLRGNGLQAGEEELPENEGDEEDEVSSQARPQANAEVVAQLVGMGFPQNRCEKAALNTNNSSVEAAMEWLLMHMDDPDIDAPLSSSGNGSNSAKADVDSEQVQNLVALGFSEKAAITALRETGGNPERAADWLFSRGGEVETLESTEAQDVVAAPSNGDSSAPKLRDGRAKYKLHSFISHMGPNTHSGHYVCHIRMDADDSWVIFNDSKVGISREPPLGYGYIYFFKRIEQ